MVVVLRLHLSTTACQLLASLSLWCTRFSSVHTVIIMHLANSAITSSGLSKFAVHLDHQIQLATPGTTGPELGFSSGVFNLLDNFKPVIPQPPRKRKRYNAAPNAQLFKPKRRRTLKSAPPPPAWQHYEFISDFNVPSSSSQSQETVPDEHTPQDEQMSLSAAPHTNAESSLT